MKITIESTTKVVKVGDPAGTLVEARIWEGTTEDGIPVHVFITRLAPTIPIDDPRQKRFQEQLQEKRAPSAAVECYPARMIL
jgi:hypothetical protein